MNNRKGKSKIDKIIVIGASAGGIDALAKVISGLPANLPAAILIVQHLTSGQGKTNLPDILARHALMPVYLAQNDMTIEENVVYVAEPGKHLIIKNDRLALKIGDPVRFVRPSVDVLFSSAAEACGSGVIGIILTGIGSDGAQGCRKIKSQGGNTVAQDKDSSAFFDMPEAAIKAGAVDYVLPLDEIAEKIMKLLEIRGIEKFRDLENI